MFKVIERNKHYSIDENGVVINNKRNKVVRPYNNKTGKGYLYVCLYNGHQKQGAYAIHRLVAETFIPNPYNKKEVNHINGNTLDNRICNLEWVSHKENVEHAVKEIGVFNAYKIHTDKCKKSVIQIDMKTNEVVARYESVREAEYKTGINASYISNCANKKQKYAKGYYWRYVEVDDDK